MYVRRQFLYLLKMEEKKAQISNYLRSTVSPFVTPLMEELVRKRPGDLLIFAKKYVEKLIEQRDRDIVKTENSISDPEEDQEEIERKFQEKLLKKKGVKKISRQGISAQAYGVFNKKEEFVPKVIPKDNGTKTEIKELLKKSLLFGNLEEYDMNIVLDAVTVEQKKKNDFIIKEGEEGNILYIVGSGEYKCSKVIKGAETYLKTYKKGESFGELALMYNAPRAATIECEVEGTIYGLDRSTFKNIVEEAANRRRQKFRNILSKVSILSEIDPYEKEQLCDILKEENYGVGEVIVKEGDEGNKFYMVAEGDLIAEKSGKKVFEFHEGDYFGQISLIRNTPRQATVKCLTKTKVVAIDRDAFKRMFGPIEQILRRNEEKYKQFVCN